MPCGAEDPSDPPARLSLRDRLELLAFEARFAGFPESLIQALWQAIDTLPCSTRAERSRATSAKMSDQSPHFVCQ
jgi:hypothetical protein